MTTEDMVKRVLEENFCLSVEKIPECEQRTPDYHAYAEGEDYLIEVKEKESNPDMQQGREEAFAAGELFEIAQSIEPQTVLSNIVRSGKQQITSFADNDATYRIIWIHCKGLGYEATREQIVAGIYGAETLVDWGGEEAFSGLCYYFSESLFFRYRNDIDAVIISCRNGEVQMCLNDHSARYDALKSSSLATNLGDGLHDPQKNVEEGCAFMVDASIDRGNKGAVLEYLKNKYNTEQLMVMKMKHIEAHMAIPHK